MLEVKDVGDSEAFSRHKLSVHETARPLNPAWHGSSKTRAAAIALALARHISGPADRWSAPYQVKSRPNCQWVDTLWVDTLTGGTGAVTSAEERAHNASLVAANMTLDFSNVHHRGSMFCRHLKVNDNADRSDWSLKCSPETSVSP